MNPFSIVALLIIIGIVVFVHEFGHFLLAKKNGVGVVEFSIGMGPRIVSTVYHGTRYSLKWIPFGGSCRMLGDDNGIPDPDAEPITDEEHSFIHKSVWARISVVAAGPIFNFILAFVLAVVVLSMAGSDKPIVTGLVEGYPASEAGLQAGDAITEINGEKIHIYRDLQLYTLVNPGKTLNVSYKRDGQSYQAVIEPQYSEDTQSYIMGIYGGSRYELSWIETFEYSWYELRYNVRAVVKSLGMVFTGKLPVTSFSGPVGIATTVDDIVTEVNEATVNSSFKDRALSMFLTLANFVILISANLGVMNLLPIPAMDGGRLVFLIIEAVRGKPVPKEKEAIVHVAGFMFLFLFMIFILFSDIYKIFQ